MELAQLTRKSDIEWWIEPKNGMRVPGIIYGTETLVRGMDQRVYEQVSNVAALPGIETASYAMPDAHWGYGFAIGGVAAFNAERGGVISAGGVGFDISCGVRLLETGLHVTDVEGVKPALADALYRNIPAGVGSVGRLRLDPAQMDAMLAHGAKWAVECGYGHHDDLERIEERGCMPGARPDQVSAQAKKRQRDEMGTLGSGNHYLEVQKVVTVFDAAVAQAFGLREGEIVVSVHCGSRGLGHQIGTEFLKRMVQTASEHGLSLPDRELACAPVNSPVAEDYLGAMRAGINCAFANRQIITHLLRQTWAEFFPNANMALLYDVSHNTCKVEQHVIDGKEKQLFVHRKGATRAFGPGHPELPSTLAAVGQPVLIGGTMGTASYVLVGTGENLQRSFGSSCHGAGRAMSRHEALRHYRGRQVIDELASRGVIIRSPSSRGVAEEAPGAYKDVGEVVDAADRAGLSKKVARLEPLICIKG